jgi:hypothetical protein
LATVEEPIISCSIINFLSSFDTRFFTCIWRSYFWGHIFEVIFLGSYSWGHIFGVIFLGSYFWDHILAGLWGLIFAVIFWRSYFWGQIFDLIFKDQIVYPRSILLLFFSQIYPEITNLISETMSIYQLYKLDLFRTQTIWSVRHLSPI